MMHGIRERAKATLRGLFSQGFFHIFIGNTLVQVISLSSAMLLPRLLSSTEAYGMLSTVDNFNAYLILLNGMGLSVSVLRFCSLKKKQSEKSAVLQFSVRAGLVFNGILLLVVMPLLLSSQVFDGTYGAAKAYILIACLIPTLTFLLDLVMSYLRANFLNKEYARISVLYTLFYAGFQILFALLFALKGVFFGRYLALCSIVAFGLALILRKKLYTPPTHSMLSKTQKWEILKFGWGSMISNFFSMMMPLNETLVVNMVLQDLTTTAFYKAASTVPSNLQFIASSVAVYIYPYFAKNTGNGRWIRKYTLLTVLGVAAIMIPLTILGYFFSPLIIRIIYGEAYTPAIPIMRAMWVAFAINSIVRIPLGNILAAIGELRFNMILSAGICGLHFLLDFWFISKMGIGGAAYALALSYIVSGILSMLYLLYYCARHESPSVQ